jgi:hypothetical protein
VKKSWFRQLFIENGKSLAAGKITAKVGVEFLMESREPFNRKIVFTIRTRPIPSIIIAILEHLKWQKFYV